MIHSRGDEGRTESFATKLKRHHRASLDNILLVEIYLFINLFYVDTFFNDVVYWLTIYIILINTMISILELYYLLVLFYHSSIYEHLFLYKDKLKNGIAEFIPFETLMFL